ncbi:MAG TPA: hypothetical protein VJX29_09435 [Candidatus Acidoferrales bacterium]|nr:hypothetical protein [Candidatus Acidoferrales bacterium]
MRRSHSPTILHAFLSLSLFAAIALPAFAQTPGGSAAAQPTPHAYDITKEVILRGTISQVVQRPAAGLPLGLHLMVATGQGTVDVHLGPYLGRIAAEKGLVAGAAIQMYGVTTHFAAGDVFLARIVVVGNQTITVRSENGFPVRPIPAGARTTRGPQPAGGL